MTIFDSFNVIGPITSIVGGIKGLKDLNEGVS